MQLVLLGSKTSAAVDVCNRYIYHALSYIMCRHILLPSFIIHHSESSH